MVKSPTQPDANLVEFLRARARTASDGRLALDAGIGFLVAIVALIWRPAGWHVIGSAALCFVAFGAWGITDREWRERRVATTESRLTLALLGLGRACAIAIGVLAAVTLVFGLLGLALGTWIS